MATREEMKEIRQGLKEISEGKVVPLSLLEKREEIREVIDLYADDGCFYPNKDCEHRGGEYCTITERAYECLMKRLDKIGVVIKVDRELPTFYTSKMPTCEKGLECSFVEPLIKE